MGLSFLESSSVGTARTFSTLFSGVSMLHKSARFRGPSPLNPGQLVVSALEACAHRVSGDLHALGALDRAAAVWSDSDALAGFSPITGAMVTMESYGVGALFLDTLGDVAVDEALAQQEEIARASAARAQSYADAIVMQTAISEAEKGFVQSTIDAMKAAPDNAAQILNTAYQYSPSAVASRALEQASSAYLEALRAADESTRERVKAARDALAEALKKGRDAGFVTLGLLIGGPILLATALLLSGRRKSSQGGG